MTEQEKEIQKALGLEKGFVTSISVMVPVWVSLPFIAKGFSEKEVRERMWNLPNDTKKKIIHYICRVLTAMECLNHQEYGADAASEVELIARKSLRDVNPEDLDNNFIEIETEVGIDTIADAIKYMKEEVGILEDEILII